MPQTPSTMPFRKYIPFHKQIRVDGNGRTWPDVVISKAPRWCSVDLRDGNQALIEPMNNERKLAMWNLLVRLGFKEIEVGFPSASQTDFDFIRLLIDQDLIPEDVTIGVLTQAREHLIRRTYEALKGAKSAYVHLYNSTSVLQRDVVFNMEKDQIIDLAVEGAKLCKSLEHLLEGTTLYYEYSPESFTGTEPEFAAQISNAVAEVFQASKERPVVINLPSTVEMTTPNVYADSIEWMCKHLGAPTNIAPDDGLVPGRADLSFTREHIVVSLHPHNDQGMGIAAAHLGIQAGADRVEGCIFGNGERTGNVDTIALALNLFTSGVDPELEIHDIKEIRRTYEHCNQLAISERYPYAGDLVFTAFSGSHQDAIKKGLQRLEERKEAGEPEVWAVPYLPIDPRDIGASYESVIRVNSQSGKGGVAYILKSKHNLDLPKRLQIEFSSIVQKFAEISGSEVGDSSIYRLFCDEYLPSTDFASEFAGDASSANLDAWGRIKVLSISNTSQDGGDSFLKVKVQDKGEVLDLTGIGNGPMDAFISAISPLISDLANDSGGVQILDYTQHAMTTGQDAQAAAYVECRVGSLDLWGVGIDSSTTKASLKAIVSAVNRAARRLGLGGGSH
ncbi:MAG: 2-isopropylmalate synthase [Candidatus Ancillula sp.]|jgi:2-isopropylmalate synthase|nr:2-isopropylmalate synthase [Candidatus Ancillula sp.]